MLRSVGAAVIFSSIVLAGGLSSLNAARPTDTILSYSKDTRTFSANIRNTPLSRVLQKLSRESGIVVFLEGSSADATVSATFKNLPIEKAIRRLLQGRNYVLGPFHGPHDSKGSIPKSIISLRILNTFPRQADALETIAFWPVLTSAAESPVDIRLLVQEAMDADPPGDTDASSSLVETADNTSSLLENVMVLLQDHDHRVRKQALDMLEDNSEAAADEVVNILDDIILTDPSPEMRAAALEVLADCGDKNALFSIQQALTDSDPQVTAMAAALIEELEDP